MTAFGFRTTPLAIRLCLCGIALAATLHAEDAAPQPPENDVAPDDVAIEGRGIYSGLIDEAHRKVVGVRGQRRGSGILLSDPGYVLTSSRVLDAARVKEGDITEVLLPGGLMEEGEVIGTDERGGVTLIRIPKTSVRNWKGFALNGTLPEPFPGTRVLTLSNAANSIFADYQVSTSVGSVHGILPIDIRGEQTGTVIEVEALSINVGSSGGALVDMDGRLRGILQGWHRDGIFFGQAIPVSRVAEAVERIERRSAGLDADTEPGKGAYLGGSFAKPIASGVVITSVRDDSPLAEANLRVGDVILAVNGRAVDDRKALDTMLLDLVPGTQLSLLVRRRGEFFDLPLAVAEPLPRGNLGFTWEAGSGKGVKVKSVPRRGPARRRLRANDVVLEINGFEVNNDGDMARLEPLLYEGARLEILLERGGNKQTTTIRVGRPPEPEDDEEAEDEEGEEEGESDEKDREEGEDEEDR